MFNMRWNQSRYGLCVCGHDRDISFKQFSSSGFWRRGTADIRCPGYWADETSDQSEANKVTDAKIQPVHWKCLARCRDINETIHELHGILNVWVMNWIIRCPVSGRRITNVLRFGSRPQRQRPRYTSPMSTSKLPVHVKTFYIASADGQCILHFNLAGTAHLRST